MLDSRSGIVLATAVALLKVHLALADPPGPSPDVSTVTSAAPPNDRIEQVSLFDAVRRALAQNPTVAIADDEIRRAHAIVDEVRANALPSVTGNAIYTRLDADRVLTVAGGPPRVIAAANQFTANATVVAPVVVPQRWAQWSHARDGVGIAQAGAADARRQIAIATARAYLAVSSQHRIVATYQRAAANARAHYEFAHARFAGGIGNRIDEVRAAQELEADLALIAAQRVVLAREQEALGMLMGLDRPIDAVEDVPIEAGPTMDVALREAETRRSDVRLLQSRVQAARATVRDDWTDYAPSLLGTFQAFYQEPPSLTTPPTGWQAQLILSVPFYDGGLRYGQAHERDALLAESRAALDAALRQARSDVRTAFDEIHLTTESAAAAHRSAQLADEALQLALLAYREGATTNLDVIDAERRARDATAAAHMADDNVRQARLDLLIAAGRFP